MQKFYDILLFIHQLPQNIIGLLVIWFTGARKTSRHFEYVAYTFRPFGVSLGNFIIFGKYQGSTTDYLHEYGHHRQSLYLGWLYLFVIGIPSLCGNIWDRLFHKNWTDKEREKWYYSQKVEHWADCLGNVDRGL